MEPSKRSNSVPSRDGLASTTWELQAQLRQARKHINKLEQEAASKKQSGSESKSQLEETHVFYDADGDTAMLESTPASFDEGKYRARIQELDKQIGLASKAEGQHWITLRNALTGERYQLQHRLNEHKPVSAQMFALNRQLHNEAQKIEKQRMAIAKQHKHVDSVVAALEASKQESVRREAKLEEMRQRQLELARQAAPPPTAPSARAAPED
eukprot:523158-Pyramimonas_sp.AAC.2